MCYKNEKQKKEQLKLDAMLKDIPEFIQDYFVFLTSTTSKLNYWSAIRQLLEWLVDQKIVSNDLNNLTSDDLNGVTDVHIIKYLDGLKNGVYGKQCSLSTCGTKRNMFSGFWNYLQDKDYVNKNIVSRIPSDKYKTKDKEVTLPTDEEIELFIGKLEGIKSEIISIRNVAIVKLFIGSGIRIEELVGLDVDDLHVNKDGNVCIWVMGKGNQDENAMEEVLISKEAHNAINRYLLIRNANENFRGLKPMFLSERSERLSQSMIQDFFNEYSNGAIHPHMLRHYAGTMLYQKSENNLELVREQLRHGNINTTAKYYVKNDKSETVNVLNSF